MNCWSREPPDLSLRLLAFDPDANRVSPLLMLSVRLRTASVPGCFRRVRLLPRQRRPETAPEPVSRLPRVQTRFTAEFASARVVPPSLGRLGTVVRASGAPTASQVANGTAAL